MLIFWHIVAAFFFVLGFLEFILEIKKAIFNDRTEGIWLFVFIDSENEERAERILRKAAEISETLPVMVCYDDVSPETETLCGRICDEEGFEEI